LKVSPTVPTIFGLEATKKKLGILSGVQISLKRMNGYLLFMCLSRVSSEHLVTQLGSDVSKVEEVEIGDLVNL
jgi:hypothetical protein